MTIQPQRHERKKYWVFALFVACVTILISGFVSQSTQINSTAYIVGFAFGSAVVAACVFTLVFGRLWTGMGAAAFGAILACFVVALFITNERSKAGGRTFLESLQGDIIEQVANSTGTEALKPISTTPSQGGAMGVLEQFVRTNFNEQVDLQRRYLAALDALRWETVLDPQRLNDDSDLSKSLSMVENARRVMQLYRDEDTRRVEQIPARLDALQISERDREAAKNGALRAMETDKPDWQQTWDLEAAMIEDFERIVRLLKDQQGRWVVEDAQIIFDEGDSADNYNALLTNLDAKIAEQEAVAKRMSDRLESRARQAQRKLN